MAKPVIKKSAESKAPKAPAPAPVAEKATRNRPAVLVQVTASYLRDKIGADTKIGVSRKQLTAILAKAQTADLLSDLPA